MKKQLLPFALAATFFNLLFLPQFASAQKSRIWATYYGGAGLDLSSGVATDAEGNVYMAGITQSTSGIASGGFQNTYGGGYWGGFLVKFNAGGNRLWATYYGGGGSTMPRNVATDAAGNVYLVGQTFSTDSIAFGGFQNTYGGGEWDAFLVKFDANGNRLWATYYGGSGDDEAFGVATDTAGNVYLAGFTNDSTTGIASGGFQNTYGGGNYDAFLVKFDSNGNRLWGTYYGGEYNDWGRSVSTDASGNVYLTGYTTSTTGIASGGFQNTIGGNEDAFLVKFDASGNRLWATYYGGSETDEGYGVTTDAAGNVFLAGWTRTLTGLASPGGFQTIAGGGYSDAFLVKFNGAGHRLWATYYGGTDMDQGWGVATDKTGNVYLTGTTNSSTNIASGGFQDTYGGSAGTGTGGEPFLTEFNTNGYHFCGTYFGGMTPVNQSSIAIDAAGYVYIASHTSDSSGIAFEGFQNHYGGNFSAYLDNWDADLIKFTSCTGVAGINDFNVQNSMLYIYPNPSTNSFTIKYISSGLLQNFALQILNPLGAIVYSEKLSGKNEYILQPDLAAGIYFVELNNGEKKMIQKLIIE